MPHQSSAENRSFRVLLFKVLLLAIPLLLPLRTTAQPPQRHVLLLHSYHKGMSWADDITVSFTSTLKKKHQDVEFHVEYMDTKRVLGKTHLHNLFTEYRHKFGNQKFDLIATADDAALRFALKHQGSIFPGVPLVFCGVNNFSPDLVAGNPLVTGVTEDVAVTETVGTALRLQPDTKNIFIINDMSQTGQGLHAKIAEGIKPFIGRVSFTFLEDYTVDHLADMVKRLPADSIVLRSAFFLDRKGQTFPTEQESFAAIDRHASVPVYSLWDFYMGLGIVGGKLVSGTAQGEMAAHLAGRILDGERPANVPIVHKSPNQFMFDYRQLQRWHINRSALPPGSIVINAPKPFYAINKTLTWSVVVFTAIISLAAVFLVISIRRRRHAEALLRASHDRLLEQQQTLAAMMKSETFTSSDLEQSIHHLLETGVRQMGVERISLWRYANDRMAIRCVDLYEVSSRRHIAGMELRKEDYPAYFAALETNEAIVANDARTHPQTAEFSESYLKPLGITSMLDVPIHLYGKLEGVLCNEHVGNPVPWTPEQRFFAIAVSNLIALALEQQERKNTEEYLRLAETKFRELFNSVGDAIIIHDLTGRIHEVNQRVCDRLDYRRNELLAMNVKAIGLEHDSLITHHMSTLVENGRHIFESECMRRDGSRFPVEFNCRVIHYEGQPSILSVIRDITSRKEMERLKDEMVSAVSHEMRTPLTAIIGYTAFMLETRMDESEQREHLQTIQNATKRLDDLINCFLDLQRFRASWKSLSLQPISLSPLLAETATLFAKTSQRHLLVTVCPPDLPLIHGNAEHLIKVLTNLVSNALKYSPDGGEILVTAQREGENALIMVRDQGIGIAPEHKDVIFDRFYRVDNSNSRRVGGTGLGLSLVQQIVNAHQGKVWVESTLGEGSTFYVSLPLARQGEDC